MEWFNADIVIKVVDKIVALSQAAGHQLVVDNKWTDSCIKTTDDDPVILYVHCFHIEEDDRVYFRFFTNEFEKEYVTLENFDTYDFSIIVNRLCKLSN